MNKFFNGGEYIFHTMVVFVICIKFLFKTKHGPLLYSGKMYIHKDQKNLEEQWLK